MIAHSMSQVPHTSLLIRFGWRFFFFPWNYGVTYGHVLQASSCASEWRANPGVVFRSDIDITSWWWRTWIAKGAHSSWSRFPSNLVLPHFPKLLHPGDFIVSQPRFWWWTQNHLWRLLRDWRHLHLRMVFNSWHWTLSLVARSNSPIAS
jgi:hypothetical protein